MHGLRHAGAALWRDNHEWPHHDLEFWRHLSFSPARLNPAPVLPQVAAV